MRQLNPFAVACQDNGVIADYRAAAQACETDAALLART
jgi:hypothetical protein